METVDVIVLGGGVAGVCAALAAASTGARTVLIRRGPGVTALAAGAWIGEPPAAVAAALSAAGLPLVDCAAPLPHPVGRLVAADAAPVSHARAAIAAGAERALVCGIGGLPGFRANALAALWRESGGLPDHALEPVTLSLDGTPAGGWSPVSLAAHLEDEPDRLAGPLTHAVRERGAARVLLPAVLGIENHAVVHSALESAVGVAIGEALGVAPSLPGWRLDRALQQSLVQAGVQLLTGVVDHTEHDDNAVMVTVHMTGARPDTRSWRAGALVLAAGKFAGGGIAADTSFRDTAMGSPIVLQRLGRRFIDASESLAMTDPVRHEPQPLLRTGVAAEPSGCPLPAPGAKALRNVFVAGSVREGTETATLGLGHAAGEGWEAGLRAAGKESDMRSSWA
ncbi:hypothetical protein BH23GEM9_BH23GEM9_06590 [soil metagenome]